MALDLERSGSASVSTSAGWAATAAGPFHRLSIFGGDVTPVEVPLSAAITAMMETIDNPADVSSLSMQGLKRYLHSLRIETVSSQGGVEHAQVIVPDEQGQRGLQRAFGDAQQEASISFLGNILDRSDFVGIVHYIMTNTSLHPEMPDQLLDPREALIRNLRYGDP